MRAIVVYDSRTGNTAKVGEAIAKGLGCEHTHIDRTAMISPEKYDAIVIGTPIYFLSMSTKIKNFLKKNNNKFKNVALFCTYSFGGSKKVLKNMETIANCNVLDKLSVVGEFKLLHIKRGRPNDQDLRSATQFGNELRKKFEEE